MIVLNGKGVCGGIAFGKVLFYQRRQQEIRQYRVENTEQELERLHQALKQASQELGALYQKALREVGEKDAEIFQIHQMMLDDADYVEGMDNIVRTQKVNAEFAVATTRDKFETMFSGMQNTYMKARSSDIRDISERVLAALSGCKTDLVHLEHKGILAADELTPSETVQLDRSKITAFLTVSGSSNSHTAILARTMNLPAVVGIGAALNADCDGMDAIVDGFEGKVYLQPDEQTAAAYEKKQREEDRKRFLAEQYKGKESVTLDGRKIRLFANIGGLGDVEQVLKNDAEGVGLFRSEFLYLKNSDYPTEEEQFSAYRAVLERMGEKQVLIRTMDIGADKKADYFDLPEEANPALGYRAIRICLTRPELFKTQLRALFRASVFGNLGIMFPMIISLSEVLRIKEIVEEVKRELSAEHLPYAEHVPLGIMIETPAAALISDRLAAEVDFFSIGTNDLTQYTLAIDRQNQNLEAFYNPRHLAVLRLIQMIVSNAHRHHIWAGICGELAADSSLTETFLALGVDELSVTPSAVLGLRKTVCEADVSQVRDAILKDIL